MTAAGTRDDVVADWLNTQALQLAQAQGLRARSDLPLVYPKRSELRRAEARQNPARRSSPAGAGSDRRPSGSRPPAGGHHPRSAPPGPTAGARSPERRSAPRVDLRAGQNRPQPIAITPTPAVLPVPHTGISRPAGVTLPSRRLQSVDAFVPAADPTVPIVVPQRLAPASPVAPPSLAAPATAIDPSEWGLDDESLRSGRRRGQDPARPQTRVAPAPPKIRPGLRGRARAARLLILALVVGAEGVAVTSIAGVSHPRSATSSATAGMVAISPDLTSSAVLDDAAQRQDSAVASQSEAFQLAIAQNQAGDAKVAAAQAQAKAAADRVRAEARKREQTLRNAQQNPQAVAKMLLADRGWSSQWSCLNSLWTRESGWNYRAYNPSSGAYGIPQALPGSKMSSYGSDWRTNPVTQMKWGLYYISERYGTPCGAWAHSQDTGWY